MQQYRRRRVVGVTHRVVFGTLAAVQAVLAPLGCQSNIVFAARLNLNIRQRVAAVGRRVNTGCQGEDGLQHQLAVFPRLPQFRAAPCEPAPAPPDSRTHQAHGLSQGVAAVYASDGGRID